MSSTMNDAELYQLFLATPIASSTLTVPSANNITIPYNVPPIEDILKVIYQRPEAKKLWFDVMRRKEGMTGEELMTAFFELILELGSKTINTIISLGTPWPQDPKAIEVIGRWSNTDRMRALMAIKGGNDWESFFALFSSSTETQSENSQSNQGVTIEDLTAAVSETNARSPESSQSKPASTLPTPQDSPSIPAGETSQPNLSPSPSSPSDPSEPQAA